MMPPERYGYPRISPDGTRFAINSDNAQIWICDVETGRRRRLTQGGINYIPVWSADGKRIAFTSYRSGHANIFWKSDDNDDPPQALVVSREERKYPASLSPGDRVLIYNTLNPTTGGDIWSLSMGGSSTPLLNSRFQERCARLSPDGRCLAYVSDESGRDEVYIRPFPGEGETKPVSTDGGTQPVWSPTGRELFYTNGKSMMAVEIGPGPQFRPGKPRRLFEWSFAQSLMSANYDISRDNQRFLMVNYVADTQPDTELKVFVNWFEELERLVPTGK